MCSLFSCAVPHVFQYITDEAIIENRHNNIWIILQGPGEDKVLSTFFPPDSSTLHRSAMFFWLSDLTLGVKHGSCSLNLIHSNNTMTNMFQYFWLRLTVVFGAGFEVEQKFSFSEPLKKCSLLTQPSAVDLHWLSPMPTPRLSCSRGGREATEIYIGFYLCRKSKSNRVLTPDLQSVRAGHVH